MLLVHAHPDDETTSTGATMARYASEGAAVTLVTCTLGELGEVVVPELAQLASDQADQLGGYRIGELSSAMKILGVTDYRFLGGPGAFRDSGMMGTPGNGDPRAFWRAESDPAVFAKAVTAAVEVIRETRPQVVLTYDTNGGYGHPDHIMAHRVAMAAVEAAGDPTFAATGEPWQVSKVYWAAIPYSVLQMGIDAARESGIDFFGAERAEDMGIGCADELVTTAIDAHAFASAKVGAMRAHASQIAADGPFLSMVEKAGEGMWGREYYRLVVGEVGAVNEEGHETDIFAGVAE